MPPRPERLADQRADTLPISQLVRALRDEASILQALRAVLARQRQGVTANHHDMIETSVREMERTLWLLDETRRGRQALIATMGERGDQSLTDLESWFPSPIPDDLRRAADAVRSTAAMAACDLAETQRVLDRALQAGDAFLQRLFSDADDPNLQPVEADPADNAVVNPTG